MDLLAVDAVCSYKITEGLTNSGRSSYVGFSSVIPQLARTAFVGTNRIIAAAHRRFYPENRLANRYRMSGLANLATNRQVDRGAQRRSRTSVAELRRESSCHSQDSGRGVD